MLTPYYDDGAVRIFHGDARQILPDLEAESLITDPVWPNSIFPDIQDPQALLGQALDVARVNRVVVHIGADSDPRFLQAVPKKFRFFSANYLEYWLFGFECGVSLGLR